MIFIIEFGNKCVIRILNKAAVLTLSKQLAKCFQLRYVILKKPETRSHNFAGGSISTTVKLGCNKIIKMRAKGDACVLAHLVTPNKIPIIGIFWYKMHNKSIVQADIAYSTEEHGKIKSIMTRLLRFACNENIYN